MEQKTQHKLTVDRQPTTNKKLSADSITEDLKRHTLKRQRGCQQVENRRIHCSSSSWSKHEPIKQLNEHEFKYLNYAIATPTAISITSKPNDLDTPTITSSANELNNDKSN